jgi:N-methylhydantoinase B
MYQEGMVFPATKVYERGVENADFFNLIKFNSRMPERTIGDIQAQVSACVTGVRRTQEIAEKYGVDVLIEAMKSINSHGERLARLALAKLPNGTWSASDFVDNDGVDLDRQINMNVTVTITDDEMIIDWTGSEHGVRGPINIPVGMTEALCSLIFKSLTTPDTPVVAGNFAPMRVITEPGSVMHAVAPMPTFTIWTALLAGEVILKALAKGMPDLVPACSGGDISSMMGLGTNPRNGQQWLEATNEAVGSGAHSRDDGEDGVMHLSEPGARNNPVEVLETKSPMLIERYGYRTDSGGPGRFRGGVGVAREYRFLAPSVGICMVYKTISKPWAIGEGMEGDNNHIIINPGTAGEVVKRGSYNNLGEGEVLLNNTGGGGGYGHPFDREPARVVNDVRNGYVSAEAAERYYGVAIDLPSFEVDEGRTRQLRSAAGRR